MIESITNFFDTFPAWIVAITALVTACAGIATLTPTRTDDEMINKALKVLNFLALNFGKAKNKDDTE